jgi:hypothetical protein
VLGAFIGVVAALAWFARWYLRRRIPADALARKPYNSTGKIFAAALVLSLVVALVLVAAFPNGWLAWLLNSGGPALFFVVAAGPVCVVALILEARGVKFNRDRGNDA